MEGMETLRKREDLREKGQKQQRKRGVEREAGREQHVPVVIMWCGSLLRENYRLEFNLTMFVLGMDVVGRAVAGGPTLHRGFLMSHPPP